MTKILKNLSLTKINLRMDRAPAKKIHQDMLKNLNYNAPEAVILICAIIIASIGLNLGSTAVVIGAMLISPIMGPLQTLGYSLAIGEKEILKAAIIRVVSMVVVALVASTIYFVLSPLNAPSDEIIARTNPTFWDLLIAIFGGFAGIIGASRSEKTNVVPGVAIATALMPPLCTAGFGIAHFEFVTFLGAFYLFSINSFFIILASTIGILLMGLRNNESIPSIINKQSQLKIQIAFTLLIIPSLFAGFRLINQEVVNSNVTNYVQAEIETDSRKVVNTEIDYENDEITLIVVGTTINNRDLAALKSRLVDYELEGYKINIVQSSLSETIISSIKSDEKSTKEE